MNNIKGAFFLLFLLLLLLCSASPPPTNAEKGESSASGSFRFSFGGVVRTVDFNVRTDKGGTSAGQMTFSGPAEIPDQDGDGGGEPGFTGLLSEIHLTAEFDCLAASGNKAAMSGVVTGSTLPAYIGQRVIMVVEDNGEGVKAAAPDRLTWGVYKENSRGWTPSDAELVNDPGVGLRWRATDAERSDDKGVPSHPSELVTCKSFPLSSYSLVDVSHGDGNIQVRP